MSDITVGAQYVLLIPAFGRSAGDTFTKTDLGNGMVQYVCDQQSDLTVADDEVELDTATFQMVTP